MITVEESNTFGASSSSSPRGMKPDKGYISPYFITDPDRQEAVLEEPYLLLVNKKVSACRSSSPSSRR